jgi:hypothetical protein
MTGLAAIDEWWASVGAAALVGTGRRAVPGSVLPVSDRPDASPEVAILDQVAVGAALRRAGRVPVRVPEEGRPAPADHDELPLAPARARQLLDLLLTQSPVGARLTPRAVEVWLTEAAGSRVRVHHATLPALLDLATATRQLRAAVVPVVDRRGVWLAGLNPAWEWVAQAGSTPATLVDEREWAALPTDARATHVRQLRAADPGRGRDLVASTWGSDSAGARTDLLRALGVGLGADDEPFLEQALDDRAAGVREVAYLLLDRLPDSARAHRLGDLLEPLVSTTGLVRKKVHVELPSAPDETAVRDGLGKAPKGRSQRGLWMQRIAAGAPLDVWTRTTGTDPATIVHTLDDRDALAGLRDAASARRDATWCRAFLDLGWDPVLARCLPADELVDRMLARVAEVKNLGELTAALRVAPGPWPARASEKILARLSRIERPRLHLVELVDVLAGNLHPSTAPEVRRLAATEDGTVAPLQQLSQFLSLVPTLTEAFR